MNNLSHIAIIMDGNGRWAKNLGKKRSFGHETGAKTVRKITEFCAEHQDIQRLTLYAFSTENWKRPRTEVEFLMKLLDKYLKKELDTYLQNNIQFSPIGNLDMFSKKLRSTIDMVQEKTAHCNGLVQSLALNYGSQDEIVRAANKLKNFPGEITPEIFTNALDCKTEVDLLIRTGGDKRLSNYLLWQAAYAELFFTDTLWPDFTTNELDNIINRYKKVERRFGGLK